MIQIDLNDTSIVGQSTPDPLRFAFTRKKSAHAGGEMRVVPQGNIQSDLNAAYNTAQLNPAPRCLYIHIPFCQVKCTYCGFFEYASSRKLIEDYVVALREEIRWKASQVWTQSALFHAVYIGGGTPTDLNAEEIFAIVNDIKTLFPLAPDCEITLEGRIHRFTIDKFESALEAGVNRFSFGIQSFNTLVRRKAKRLDDREVVLTQLQKFLSYNAAPVVIDLLYGLPHQSLEIWQQDLDDYLESGAIGVDLYQLIEMPNLPMAQMVQQGKLPPPADTAQKATMFEMGVEFMARHHQRRLSVNHWSRDNRERSLYNSLAKTTAEVMPLGAGAGGNVNGRQMMQGRNMEDYLEAIKNKQHPVKMLALQPENHATIGTIKSSFDRGVLSEARLDSVAGKGTFASLTPLFLAWQDNKLATLEQNPNGHSYLTSTLAGQFWGVTLAQNLIRVLQQNAPKKAQIAESEKAESII